MRTKSVWWTPMRRKGCKIIASGRQISYCQTVHIVKATTQGVLEGVALVPVEGCSTHSAAQVHNFNRGIPNLLYLYYYYCNST